MDLVYYVRMREERDVLRERVRALEAILFDGAWVPPEWALTHSEATLLNVLALRGLASKEVLHAALYADDPGGGATDKIIDIFIHKMRRKLAPFGIEITTQWGWGYRLDDRTRIFLTQLRQAA